MCFGPELLLAAGLTVGGQIINTREQNANTKRMAAAKQNQFRLEQDRQHKLQAESGAAADDAIARLAPQTQADQVASLITGRDKLLQGNIADESARSDYAPVTDDAPQVVKSSIAKSLSDAVAKSRGQAQRLAKLGATTDSLANNSIMLKRAGNDIARVGNFASNSASVNQAEQQVAANNAYKSPSGIGDLFNLAGQGIGLYGAMGGFGGAAGAGPYAGSAAGAAPITPVYSRFI